MNRFLLLCLPTYVYASFFDNYTNLITFSYKGNNCAVEPDYVNVSDTVSCLSYNTINECCKHIMEKINISNPLNICYNINGNSSFSSCYEQHLTQTETNTIGFLTIMGIILVISLCGTFMYTTFNCMFDKKRRYQSINH